MRETRDMGIKWPHCHTLFFEGQVAVDMRVACPQDVKKMLLKQARMVYWKKWAAKHECEELKEGVWLEPIQALLRRQTNEAWTDKHRNVTRKLVVKEDGRRKEYTILVVLTKRCVVDVTNEKARRSTDCITARRGRKLETRSQKTWGNGSKGPKPQRKIGRGRKESRRALCVKVNGRKTHLTLRRWESEKHKSWVIPVEGFRNYVATDGSLLGVSGR